MKIYLASRYSRREELCGYRAALEADGHTVTSRWLNGNHQVDDQGLSAQAHEAERVRFAVEDWEDLMFADCCISFTEIPRSERTRGGRHVEFGAALAAGKECIVIGPRENVFHCLPWVCYFASWADFRATDVLASNQERDGRDSGPTTRPVGHFYGHCRKCRHYNTCNTADLPEKGCCNYEAIK